MYFLKEMIATDDSNKPLKTLLKTEDPVSKESNFSTVDDLSKSSKTDDEKLEEMSSINASKNSEKSGDINVQLLLNLSKDVNISKSDDEKLSESKKCDASSDNEFLNDELSLDKWLTARRQHLDECLSNSDNDDVYNLSHNNSRTRRSTRIKHISGNASEIGDAKNVLEESEELSSIDLRDSLCRVSSPEMDVCLCNINNNNYLNNFKSFTLIFA
jgi:hypothetical protein